MITNAFKLIVFCTTVFLASTFAVDVGVLGREYTSANPKLAKFLGEVDKEAVGDGLAYHAQVQQQQLAVADSISPQVTQQAQQPAAIPLGEVREEDVFPNQAEPKERWLVCCDNLGNFYAKRSDSIKSYGGYMAAGDDKFINSRYCLVDESGEDLDPRYMECILTLSYTRNFGDYDKGSMYE